MILKLYTGWVVGRWVGGSHLHNNATSWPNLQVRTCKNSSQVEFQVGPSVAIEGIATRDRGIYSSVQRRKSDNISSGAAQAGDHSSDPFTVFYLKISLPPQFYQVIQEP